MGCGPLLRPKSDCTTATIRAVKQAGGGFAVHLTPDGTICFVPFREDRDEAAHKGKKPREYVL